MKYPRIRGAFDIQLEAAIEQQLANPQQIEFDPNGLNARAVVPTPDEENDTLKVIVDDTKRLTSPKKKCCPNEEESC